MHKWVKTGLLLGTALLCGAGVVSVTPAGAAQDITLTIVDHDVPLAGVEVAIFLSDGMQTGVTNENGLVTFTIDYGKGFWVEVNGDRLNQFYFVDDAPYALDLSLVGIMNWPGR